MAEFIKFEKGYTPKQSIETTVMSVERYKNVLLGGKGLSYLEGEIYELCQDLDLTVFPEEPIYLCYEWLNRTSTVRRPYFEMCGPRISKEKAMEMALDYQSGNHYKIGSMSYYNNALYNFSLFKLNGAIGLNGICWKWNSNVEVLCAILDMIKSYPEFAFAVAISGWDEMPPEKFYSLSSPDHEPFNTLDYHLEPDDVEIGFSYDPVNRRLKILNSRSAWEEVKRYQAQYTEEERRLFDPDVSTQYYTENPRGQKELAEYIEYEKKNCKEVKKGWKL